MIFNGIMRTWNFSTLRGKKRGGAFLRQDYTYACCALWLTPLQINKLVNRLLLLESMGAYSTWNQSLNLWLETVFLLSVCAVGVNLWGENFALVALSPYSLPKSWIMSRHVTYLRFYFSYLHSWRIVDSKILLLYKNVWPKKNVTTPLLYSVCRASQVVL